MSSGLGWEEQVGYSRAVQYGNIIEISGTVASDHSGEVIGDGDEYLQTKFIFMKIENILKQLDSSLSNVVRTRVFCTNIKNWERIGKAHGEFFKNIKPACTMVEVSGLIDNRFLVEIEVTAVLND